MYCLIKVLIPTVLGIAFLGSIAWAVYSLDFEPAITALALLASIVAIFADRWILERERRREVLRVLAHELYMNIGVIKDLSSVKQPDKVNRPHVYPRFYTASLTTAISSGLFTGPRDEKLCKLMNGWLQRAVDFNSRLNVSEIQAFSNLAVVQQFNEKVSEGLAAIGATKTFRELIDHVMSHYIAESGIDRGTVLFPDEKT